MVAKFGLDSRDVIHQLQEMNVIQLNHTIGLLLVLAVVVIKVIVDIAWYIIEYLLGKR